MTGGFLVIGDDVFLPPEKCKSTDDFWCSEKCALAGSHKCLNSSTVWLDVIQRYFSSEKLITTETCRAKRPARARL